MPETIDQSQSLKLLERLVTGQLVDYLNSHNILPENQSAYRANRFTETAIVKVLSDILTAIDHGDIAALALLDCMLGCIRYCSSRHPASQAQ
jgi:hypothetical protein